MKTMSGEPLRVATRLVGPDGILRVDRSSTSSPYYLKAVRYLEETEAWPEYLLVVREALVERVRETLAQREEDAPEIDVLGSDDIVEGEAALLRVTDILISAMRGGVWGSGTEIRTCTRDVKAGELLQRGELL
jgi:hypothetical protein